MPRISQLNKLSIQEKLELYGLLIPPKIYKKFEINRKNLVASCKDSIRICVLCPNKAMEVSIEVKELGNPDSIFYIELSDSKDYIQLQWDFIKVNDPEAPRYATNVDEEGRNRWLNWGGRNPPEEIKAMEVGLAPGQTRRGLRLTNQINECLDEFCNATSLKSISLEGLFYHTAIQFELHGFRYFRGFKMMKRINELFQPGGKLYEKLDGSTPFRKPEFANSVRGRSWAIHDGVLEEIDDPIVDVWEPPVMYRMVGQKHGIETFPGADY